MAWCVVLDDDRSIIWGPFETEGQAEEFSRFVQNAVDPAHVYPLRPPVSELLAAWYAGQVDR